jgi:hypothetical protein
VDLFEGEDRLIGNNHLVGTFQLDNVPRSDSILSVRVSWARESYTAAEFERLGSAIPRNREDDARLADEAERHFRRIVLDENFSKLKRTDRRFRRPQVQKSAANFAELLLSFKK